MRQVSSAKNAVAFCAAQRYFLHRGIDELARKSQPSLGVSSLDLGRSFAGRPLFCGSARLARYNLEDCTHVRRMLSLFGGFGSVEQIGQIRGQAANDRFYVSL